MIKNILQNAFGKKITPDRSQRKTADLFKNNPQPSIKPCRIGPADTAIEAVLGEKAPHNILYPLFETRGIQFPYTPDVTFGGQAEYQDFHFTHSNTPYHNFTKSMPAEISVQGTFTAQTNDEGRYLIATLMFLHSMTKMEFGFTAAYAGRAGMPPPVLRFNYLGEYMFSNIPVIITNFSYTLPRDVDYVGIRYPSGIGLGESPDSKSVTDKFGKGFSTGIDRSMILNWQHPATQVPTKMELSVTMKVQQNPRKVRREFDLETFKKGGLIKKGFI